VTCGGVAVAPGDMVIADEEGIVVLPAAKAEEILKTAEARAAKDASTSLEDWVAAHKRTIDDLVKKLGIDA
jgi:regulator of RNase E activity RraA